MLEQSLRNDIDSLWDRVWSAGVTNPLAVVDYLTALLLLRTTPQRLTSLHSAAMAKDYNRCTTIVSQTMTEYGLSSPASSMWEDTALLASSTRDIARLDIGDRNVDILGDCLEHILGHLSTAGDFGQFRTPRHIVKFLVESVKPRVSETVLDPACGTGSFLIAAHEFRNGSKGEYLGDESDWTMARIASANLVLHGVRKATIRRRDALLHATPEADVILANPPFSGTVADGRQNPLGIRTSKSELLFLALMLRRLRPDGRAAVVVPFSVVTAKNGAARELRRQLVDHHRLHAVVELPAGVFRPYTDVRTCLLFWGNRPADSVLMLRARADGYSLDDRRRPVPDDDLPMLREVMADTKVEKEIDARLGARVAVSDIRNQSYLLNPSRFLPADHDMAEHEMSVLDALEDVTVSAKRLQSVLRRIQELAS